MEYIIVFIFGLAIGSAINVIASRFDNLEHFIKGRSHCDHCKKTLHAHELIPVVSFLMQGGACAKCKKPLSWRYPLVEITVGSMFVLLYQFDALLASIFSMVFFSILMVASLIDLDTLTIPDSLMIISFMVAIGYQVVILHTPFVAIAQAVLLGLAVPALFILPSRGRAMGFGDLKLGGVMGAWLGGLAAVAVAFWAAFIAGGIISFALVLLKRKKMKDEIAFGPYLAAGALLAHLYAEKIIHYVTLS